MENVWQYMRQIWLSNRVFETYADILDAGCTAWNRLIARPETIRSIANRKWTPCRSAINAVGIRGLSVSALRSGSKG
jgi:hypothetical protein